VKPIHTKDTTVVLGAPANWSAEINGPCGGLPIARPQDDQFHQYSHWRANWRERLAILLGRPVRLCVFGISHPPVHLDTK
jgi:hypothetical protein